MSTSRYGRLRYGVGHYGGYGAPPALPGRQPATLGQPGARPLAATSALGVAGLAVPGGQPGAATPATRLPGSPRPGSRVAVATPGTGEE